MTAESPKVFASLGLAPPVLRAVEEIGYEMPSPIQAEAIPQLIAGRDLLGQAQTGTGKTAAFTLPLLSRLDLARSKPQILVLTPTRELALQVAEAMQRYARYLKGFHVLPVYGGQAMGAQLRQLQRPVHAVVGTPGRVMDHLRRGTLSLGGLTAVVLDEADEMLRMGFIDDIEWILGQAPEMRQTALFSATMPEAIRKVAHRHLKDPAEVRIKARTATVETVTQRFWQVSGVHKLEALTRILEVEPFDAMLVFVRTKTATVELAEKLEARGYGAAPLNGDLNQATREQAVDRLRRGALDVLVATDVAARGLDLERISHVVNYDIPYDTEAYVHRIGRTGRAGRRGEAILFVAPRERRMLKAIEQATRQPIEPMVLPSREAVTSSRVARFKQLLIDTLESEELGFFEDLIEGFQSEHNVGLSEIGAALAFLVQRERPLVGPEDAVEPAGVGGQEPQAAIPRTKGARPHRKGPFTDEVGLLTYRVEVGSEHGAQPKNIVGAIANEAGLESRFIGNIEIHDRYSYVDLPGGIPTELFQHLRGVRVCGQRLNISLLRSSGKPPRAGPRRSPPRAGKRSRTT